MSTTCAIKPETVEPIATAFHKSWSFISNDPFFVREDQAELQQRLSACLIQFAADGEHDPLRLANGAIRRMRQEYSEKPLSSLQAKNWQLTAINRTR